MLCCFRMLLYVLAHQMYMRRLSPYVCWRPFAIVLLRRHSPSCSANLACIQLKFGNKVALYLPGTLATLFSYRFLASFIYDFWGVRAQMIGILRVFSPWRPYVILLPRPSSLCAPAPKSFSESFALGQNTPQIHQQSLSHKSFTKIQPMAPLIANPMSKLVL